ncbi:DUF4097 family beta strand repeat-containing protein [Paenisporosarcina cavernae]|uniref:DUF1700 domain-containing protein n=1 Tax=Paenisporosarcina cavernae TaxID=2320858 RepID=A0A385YSY3_9BACL|nr:DUF4097 family beta strand repeat-containing protein [Paenisporosarcina cavernae]AYC28553.1 DUF1700 domain-containing protein [Paenisporosarcina cavernae]
MTESVFLEQLKNALGALRESERQDIVADFREYFANGREDGKTDEEIASSLGDPYELAKEMLVAYTIEDRFEAVVPDKGDFTKVLIESEHAKLIIGPSPDDQPHAEMMDHTSDTTLSMDVVGDTLEIKVIQKKRKMFIFNISFTTTSPVVKILLPKRTYESFMVENDNGATLINEVAALIYKVESDNGRIEVQDAVAEEFQAVTDNGRVMLTNVKARNVHAETDNGRIELKSIEALSVYAKSDNGRIELEKVIGKLHAETDNGRINAYIPIVTQAVRFETDNGAIELAMDRQPENATIRTKKDWGSVEIFGEKARERVFGDGSTLIDLKTDNGSIKVKNRM